MTNMHAYVSVCVCMCVYVCVEGGAHRWYAFPE